MTVTEAKELLSRYAGISVAAIRTPDDLQRAYRMAVAATHPDKPGGSHDDFVYVQQAKEIIEKSLR